MKSCFTDATFKDSCFKETCLEQVGMNKEYFDVFRQALTTIYLKYEMNRASLQRKHFLVIMFNASEFHKLDTKKQFNYNNNNNNDDDQNNDDQNAIDIFTRVCDIPFGKHAIGTVDSGNICLDNFPNSTLFLSSYFTHLTNLTRPMRKYLNKRVSYANLATRIPVFCLLPRKNNNTSFNARCDIFTSICDISLTNVNFSDFMNHMKINRAKQYFNDGMKDPVWENIQKMALLIKPKVSVQSQILNTFLNSVDASKSKLTLKSMNQKYNNNHKQTFIDCFDKISQLLKTNNPDINNKGKQKRIKRKKKNNTQVKIHTLKKRKEKRKYNSQFNHTKINNTKIKTIVNKTIVNKTIVNNNNNNTSKRKRRKARHNAIVQMRTRSKKDIDANILTHELKESKVLQNNLIQELKESDELLNNLQESDELLNNVQESDESLNNVQEPDELLNNLQESDELLNNLQEPDESINNLQESDESINNLQEPDELKESLNNLKQESKEVPNDDTLQKQKEKETSRMISIKSNILDILSTCEDNTIIAAVHALLTTTETVHVDSNGMASNGLYLGPSKADSSVLVQKESCRIVFYKQ